MRSFGTAMIYSVITISIGFVINKMQAAVFACDTDLGRFLFLFEVYFGFCATRNLVVIVLLCFCKKTHTVRDGSYITFLIADTVLIILLTFYGTKAVFLGPGLHCRDNGQSATFRWWVISCICLIYGMAYTCLLCIGLTSLPCIILFWCFYRMQMNELINESRLSHLPFAREVIRQLKRQEFR